MLILASTSDILRIVTSAAASGAVTVTHYAIYSASTGGTQRVDGRHAAHRLAGTLRVQDAGDRRLTPVGSRGLRSHAGLT